MINSPDTTIFTDTDEIVAARARLLSINTDVAVAQKSHAVLMRDIQRLTAEKTELEEKCGSLRGGVSVLEETKSGLEEKIGSLMVKESSLMETINTIETDIKNMMNEFEAREKDIEVKEIQLKDLNERTLEDMKENNELKEILMLNKQALTSAIEGIQW